MKFFLKKELMWVPVLGIAWWALDYPFMKRYSRQFVEKHPELKGKDMETTRKFCAKFKNSPVTVLNFLEGTRFNNEKHAKQNSPFAHLLLPKAGELPLSWAVWGNILPILWMSPLCIRETSRPCRSGIFCRGRFPRLRCVFERLIYRKNFWAKIMKPTRCFASGFRNGSISCGWKKMRPLRLFLKPTGESRKKRCFFYDKWYNQLCIKPAVKKFRCQALGRDQGF